eukprot:TRINITY_DN1277_c0_g1_i2.p1 TRINITY_DN1277_c0_g1~~TRINITY_DN1277_c0_g1_i2.p1  ORF type:complete len:551 (-),score=98.36 TRINITY_DN1277_c0_g1_i2:386-1993(-)
MTALQGGGLPRLVRSVLYVPFLIVWWILDIAQYYKADQSRRAKNNPFLHGNFAPVDQCLYRSSLPVTQGRIPRDLRGEFVRNGPNPIRVPLGGYHWFDGEGMLHGIRLSSSQGGDGNDDATVTYVNRYIKNARYRDRDPFSTRIGEMWGVLGLVKIFFGMFAKAVLYYGKEPNDTPRGTSNTSLVYHAGKLMTLVESSPPTWMKILNDGELETIGLYDYYGKLPGSFTAHPKIDANTGEMMTFGYNLMAPPYLNYGVIDKAGKVVRQLPVNLPEAVMMHDMAITEHYTILLDLCVVFRKEDMVKKNKVPFEFVRDRPGRFGVLPRHASSESEVRWFEIPSCYVFHVANAWETVPFREIVLYACRYTDVELDSPSPQGNTSNMYEWRIDLDAGSVTERVIAPDLPVEFPRVHPDRTGIQSQYAYTVTLSEHSSFEFDGVAKFDLLSGKVVATHYYPRGLRGGEPIFVPKEDAKDEDDGYLLNFLYSPADDRSEFWVLDAKTFRSEPVAVVPLPARVPYGFHGIWVSEEDIKKQTDR